MDPINDLTLIQIYYETWAFKYIHYRLFITMWHENVLLFKIGKLNLLFYILGSDDDGTRSLAE